MYLDELQLCDKQPPSKSAPGPNRAKVATQFDPENLKQWTLFPRSLFVSNRAIPSTDDNTKAHILVTCDAVPYDTVADTFLPLTCSGVAATSMISNPRNQG